MSTLEGDVGPLIKAHGEDEAAGGEEVDDADQQESILVHPVGFILKNILHLFPVWI